jgi:hypothetical protein
MGSVVCEAESAGVRVVGLHQDVNFGHFDLDWIYSGEKGCLSQDFGKLRADGFSAREAKKDVSEETPETVTERDGKTYPIFLPP